MQVCLWSVFFSPQSHHLNCSKFISQDWLEGQTKNKLTVLSNDDLTHLFQPGDQQLVSHNQHIADKLYVQALCGANT